MIRIERAKPTSFVRTTAGETLPVHAWLLTFGRRRLIITAYRCDTTQDRRNP